MSETNELFRKKGFYHSKTMAYIVPRWKAPEVDEIVDLVCIEATLKNIVKIKRV